MTVELIDHQAIARSRVATQYTCSLKFLDYIQAIIADMQHLETVMQDMQLQSDIDVAQGYNLDALGEIVGANRNVDKAVAITYFGFNDQLASGNFDEEMAGGGARFIEEGESGFASTALADPEYRLLIRAKIIKNHSTGTGEDILKGLAFLFGQGANPAVVGIDSSGGMAFQVFIGRPLSLAEQSLIRDLDILPRPAGVQISQRLTFNPVNSFGFDDQSYSVGMAEESSLVGGVFAEEF
jgi:hypothetical protein